MIAQKTNQRNVFKDYYSSSYKDHYQAPQDHYSRFKSIGVSISLYIETGHEQRKWRGLDDL